MPSITRIRILIAHSSPLVAFGLVAALQGLPDIEVFESTSLGVDEEIPTDVRVVVSDFNTGIIFATRAPPRGGRHSAYHVMVVTDRDREVDVKLAMKLGVRGYQLQTCSIDEFLNSVRRVAAGSREFCHSAALQVLESITLEPLTPRESDVLLLIGQGQSNKIIARELGIAVGTVKTHVKAILEKLCASCRTGAVAIAERRGLIDLSPFASRHSSALRPAHQIRIDAQIPSTGWPPPPDRRQSEGWQVGAPRTSRLSLRLAATPV